MKLFDGGYPPLFECDKKNVNDKIEKKKEREFEQKNKKMVSIKSVLEKRRNVVPFLATN